MRIILTAVGLLMLGLGGCQTVRSAFTSESPSVDPTLFAASTMRIHPIFTQVRDWDSDGKIDGIEALVEFSDQFGDPTKCAGRVIFELYEFRRAYPDPRGRRLANPWIALLNTAAEQRAHWNRASRTYGFQLANPDVRPDRSYVLTATFETSTGGRFFDRLVIEPHAEIERDRPTNAIPAPRPATRTAQP